MPFLAEIVRFWTHVLTAGSKEKEKRQKEVNKKLKSIRKQESMIRKRLVSLNISHGLTVTIRAGSRLPKSSKMLITVEMSTIAQKWLQTEMAPEMAPDFLVL